MTAWALILLSLGGSCGETDGTWNPCRADITLDGYVDIDDLMCVLNSGWGTECALKSCNSDVNEDHFIDVTDLIDVVFCWGGDGCEFPL